MEGKKEFYKKAEKSLTSKGYQYFDGDRDIHGKGKQHSNRPDYIAIKGNTIVIGEIKSPAEGPNSGSWRQIQKTDSEEFKTVRINVLAREKNGQVAPEVGGHEIIIRGQIPDYYRKIGITYDLPVTVPKKCQFVLGYTVPDSEENNVDRALKNCKNRILDKITDGNGSITYVLDFQDTSAAFIKEEISKSLPLAYYCILKNYKGFFRKKFIGNTHLYFFPVSGNRYLYLGLLGEVEGENDCYVLKLITDMGRDLLEPVIGGEIKEFKERFLISEKIPCEVNKTVDGYHLRMATRGNYIRSDIDIQFDENDLTSPRESIVTRGKLAFISEDK